MNKNRTGTRKKRQIQKSSLPIILLAAGIILILIFAIMILTNGNNPISNPDVIPRVSIAEAKEVSDSGAALIIDVRSATAYEASHVENSINIPLEELEARLGELDAQQWMIPYCT